MSYLNIITIMILLIASPTISQVATDQNSATCNNCCQGPGGLPGIPGVPGSAGSLGSPGPKGEAGSPGISVASEKGEIGVTGPQGLDGPQGVMGPPGKVGPMGIQGPSGQDGIDGLPGDLGQKGDAGMTRLSGFTVRKTSPQTTAGIVTFDTVITNAAEHYDTENHKFICQIPGYYFFTFSIGARDANSPYGTLVKNGANVVDAYINPGNEATSEVRSMGTNSALLNLAIGDEIWVTNRYSREIFAASSNYWWTTFSGVLLHET